MAGKLNVPANRYGTQITVPYAEYISNRSWVGHGSAAHGPGMILAHTYQTPWPNRFNHIKDALGWSLRNGNRMHRKLPWQHPHKSSLRATRLVGFEGVHFTGHSGNPVSGDNTDYDIARLTYSFEQLPYKLREDGEIGGEWQRYVINRQKPHSEFLSREGFEWRYVEGPFNGNVFPGRGGVPVTRKRLHWVWVQVPAAYLLDANGDAANLDAGLNKINSQPFAGYPAQTLLFEDYDLEPRMDPTDADQAAADGDVAATFDVILHITYFNPKQGGANAGWNNDPGLDWNWYLTHAFTPGNPPVDSGNPKFQTYAFALLFAAV